MKLEDFFERGDPAEFAELSGLRRQTSELVQS